MTTTTTTTAMDDDNDDGDDEPLMMMTTTDDDDDDMDDDSDSRGQRWRRWRRRATMAMASAAAVYVIDVRRTFTFVDGRTSLYSLNSRSMHLWHFAICSATHQERNVQLRESDANFPTLPTCYSAAAEFLAQHGTLPLEKKIQINK